VHRNDNEVVPQTLTDDELRRVIERAEHIQHVGEIPLDLAYDIAAELGLSRRAVTEALREVRSEKPKPSRLGFRAAMFAGLGLVLGVVVIAAWMLDFTLADNPDGLWVLMSSVLGAALLTSALRPDSKRPHLSFQVSSLLAWAIYLLPSTILVNLLAGAPLLDWFLSVFAMFAVPSAAIGGLVTWLRTRPPAPSLPSGGDSAEAGSLELRPRSRLRRWIESILDGLGIRRQVIRNAGAS